MIKVNGLNINVEPENLLIDLRQFLAVRGINLISTIRQGNNNIQFSCPSHSGGQEKKPSCGISTVDTKVSNKIIPKGTVHCFTCGYTAHVHEFVSLCLGKEDRGVAGLTWLKKMYHNEQEQVRPVIELNISRRGVKMIEKTPYIREDVLDTFRYVHDYMYKRGLTDDIIDTFDIGFDRRENCITMPVRDLTGGVVFIQTRSVATKFHKYQKDTNKTDYIYGAYECLRYFESNVTPYICESIINALSFWCQGKPALALMGTGGGKQYDILAKLPYRGYILALDPDEGGFKATERLREKLRNKKLLRDYNYPTNAVRDKLDINDLHMNGYKL